MEITITSQEIQLVDMGIGDEVLIPTARKIQSYLKTLEDMDSIADRAIQRIVWYTTEGALKIQGTDFATVNIFTAETRHEYIGSTYPLVKRYVNDILDILRMAT